MLSHRNISHTYSLQTRWFVRSLTLSRSDFCRVLRPEQGGQNMKSGPVHIGYHCCLRPRSLHLPTHPSLCYVEVDEWDEKTSKRDGDDEDDSQ